LVVRQTPRNDIYIGNFGSRQPMIQVADDFRQAGQRIVDKLVLPLEKPKDMQTLATLNHYLYKIPPSIELLRDSKDDYHPAKTGLRRTVTDEIKVAFGHENTGSPFRLLDIVRKRTEMRGRKYRNVPPREDMLSLQFRLGLKDEEPSAVINSWENEGAYNSDLVLGGNTVIDIYPANEIGDVVRFEDVDDFTRDVLNNMATAMMIAESASEHLPREESREPVLLPWAIPISSYDPHG
jgi:hypothetical protein